jgi:hypothetical protein
VPRSFLNGVWLAVSCREAGVVLITTNQADFSRIGAVEPFRFAAPWAPWPRARSKVALAEPGADAVA